MSRRPKKRCAVCGQDIVPDPLVDPGNPPHRHQACTTAHPTRAHHHMVTLAKSSPSRSTPRPPQNENATVMLAAGLRGIATTARADYQPHFERHLRLSRTRIRAGPGFCCVCGQPVYRFGWHVDLWDTGVNKNAVWHCACVIAWQFWNAPSAEARLLRRLQGRWCVRRSGRNDCGGRSRSITASRCFGCGANTVMRLGRSCSITGACQTFK